MIQTIKNIWRVLRKIIAALVFVYAFIQSVGFIQGLNYLLDGGEFVDVGGVMVLSGLIATALVVVGLIIWPGKGKREVDKGGPPKSVASPRRPERKTPQAAKGELNNEDAILMALEKGDLYGDGVDADEIPGAIGAFGLDVNNPVPVKSVLGAIEYLEDLTFPGGTKVRYKRLGSMGSAHVKHPVDAYELARESGDVVCTVFLSPYHKRNSRKKPDFGALEGESLPMDKAVFTSTYEPVIELQSVDGVDRYRERLSEFSYLDICKELSNVMSAKHNLTFIPTPPREYAAKQARITDLTDKALWICVHVFGQDAVTNINKKNPLQLNELINELDQEVAHKDLEPEKHGATLLSKLGEFIRPGLNKREEQVSSDIAGAPSDQVGKKFFKGSSESLEDTYQAGSLALMREDFQTAKNLFVAAESEGHGSATYNLFVMYGEGCLSPYDIDQAVHYWRKAVEQDHPIAKRQSSMLGDADHGEFGVQNSVKYASLNAAPGFLNPLLITSACRSLVATCERHGVTSEVIAYELDAASSSEKPMVQAFIARTGIARQVYRGGMDRIEEKSPADWITDGLNDLFFAMRRNGVDEHLCIIARCTMVGYLILKSGFGSQSSPLLGVKEFAGVVGSDSESLDDEIPF